jgi:hypothetical protein
MFLRGGSASLFRRRSSAVASSRWIDLARMQHLQERRVNQESLGLSDQLGAMWQTSPVDECSRI